MRKALRQKFFNRPTLRVTQDLLGKYLVRKIGSKTIAYKITEVEAYVGMNDFACHASHGKTSRNAVMFGPPGVWYVYFTYGIHWMLNVVTERDRFPAAVLIRGVEGISGPARLTYALKIDKRLNGKPAIRKTSLRIEDRGTKIDQRDIRLRKRIGIGKSAGVWRNKLWNFSISSG